MEEETQSCGLYDDVLLILWLVYSHMSDAVSESVRKVVNACKKICRLWYQSDWLLVKKRKGSEWCSSCQAETEMGRIDWEEFSQDEGCSI